MGVRTAMALVTPVLLLLQVNNPKSGRARLLVPVLLAVLIVAANQQGNVACADSRWSLPTAVSLLDEHNFNLDEFRPALEASQWYAVEQIGNHYYGIFPFGTPILVVPAVALLRPMAALVFRVFPSLTESIRREQHEQGCPPMGGEPLLELHTWFERFIASGIVAVTALMLYAIAREELSIVGASVIALVFAFGTPAWSTATRSLWQHGPSMLALTFALVLQRRASLFWLLGIVLGFAYVIRPTNSVPLVLGTIWVAWTHRKHLLKYLLGMTVVLGPFVLINYLIYGGVLSPYYHPGRFGRNAFLSDALLGTLVSPGRGLLIYSPALLFSFAGIIIKIRQHRITSLDVTLVGCVIMHWVAIAVAGPNWWGGFSYGPRFFTDMVPYLIYFLIPVIGWLTASTQHLRVVAATSFALAAALSVLMHAQGVFNREAILWNAQPISIDADSPRLWNWRYPPFLAGLIKTPYVDIDINAVKCETAPAAPSQFAIASNHDNAVVASWVAAPGPVALYIVESGNASGMSDLPAREVDGRTLQINVQRIPPGTYYARVLAKNACGTSPASNEVKVVVK